MATDNTTSAPWQLSPKVDIPSEAKWTAWDGWSFAFRSGQEEIKVTVDGMVSCHGSLDALVSAGIMLRDWIPANGRQSHCVLFGSDGPTIRTGNRGRPKGDYMLVTNRGPNDVYVRFPATPEQRTAFQERRKQESAAKQREDVRSQVTVAGITHEQSRDGTWKRWTGERVKLVEMEVCREDQFPEGRKRHKYGDVWVVRRLPGGMFVDAH